MINFGDVTGENMKEHNPRWSRILDSLEKQMIYLI